MAVTLHVDVVSAEESIYSGQANMVVAPAEMGEVGIHPNHTPLLARLLPGELRLIHDKAKNEEEHIYISGGLLEVQPHTVTVLADTAIRAADIDEAAALEAKKQAEEALADRQGDFDYARAQADLAQAVAQLRTLERLRRKLR